MKKEPAISACYSVFWHNGNIFLALNEDVVDLCGAKFLDIQGLVLIYELKDFIIPREMYVSHEEKNPLCFGDLKPGEFFWYQDDAYIKLHEPIQVLEHQGHAVRLSDGALCFGESIMNPGCINAERVHKAHIMEVSGIAECR